MARKRSVASTAIAVLSQLEASKVRSTEYQDFVDLRDLPDDSDADEVFEKTVEESITPKKPPKWHKYLGFIFAILSSLIFSLTALIVQNLEHFHPFSIALWRFQGAFLPVIPLIVYKTHLSEKKKPIFDAVYPLTEMKKLRMFSLVMLRSVLSCNSLLLHFFSLKYLHIGDALTIASSTPIFVTILSRVFLGEKCGYITGVALATTLIGVVIITKPPLLTGALEFDHDTLIGTVMALGCMLLAAISFTVLRYIRNVHYSVTTLMFGIWGVVENFILAIIFHVLTTPQGMTEWMYVGGLATLTFFGQIAIILAMKCEQAGPVSVVRTLDVIFGYAGQIIILKTLPDQYSVVGASIVVISVAVVGLKKWINTLPPDTTVRKRLWFLVH